MNLKKLKLLIFAIFLSAFLQNSAISAEREINCLSEILYFEARGEPIVGKKMVAASVLNRVENKSFPNSICKNMEQKGQFSFMKNIDRKITDFNAYNEIRHLAKNIISKGHDYPKNMLYFTHKEVNNRWTKRIKVYRTVGNHTFYQSN